MQLQPYLLCSYQQISQLTLRQQLAAGKQGTGQVFMPAAGTDTVAESLLQCCSVLLKRCPPHSSEQLLELLDRFANIAGLPGKLAAEEV